MAIAARDAFDAFAADTLSILADADDAALRVYRSVSVVASGWQPGLERAPR